LSNQKLQDRIGVARGLYRVASSFTITP